MALAFQDFQRDFGRHLRDPHHAPRPAGLPARRVAAYNELLFNNICGFLDACFPVSRELLGESRWRRLNRTFYRDWPLHTPWFREIPREFVRYLADAEIATARPRWLAELAHYEWAELGLQLSDAALPPHDPHGHLLDGAPLLSPLAWPLAYRWPVNRIGPDFQPVESPAEPTLVLLRREPDGRIHFSALSPLLFRLLELVGANDGRNGRALLLQLADEAGQADYDAFLAEAAPMLQRLRDEGVLRAARPR